MPDSVAPVFPVVDAIIDLVTTCISVVRFRNGPILSFLQASKRDLSPTRYWEYQANGRRGATLP